MAEKNTAAADRSAWIAALETEKRGYEVRGLKDRAKQVDAAIDAAKGVVRGRSTKGQEEA